MGMASLFSCHGESRGAYNTRQEQNTLPRIHATLLTLHFFRLFLRP